MEREAAEPVQGRRVAKETNMSRYDLIPWAKHLDRPIMKYLGYSDSYIDAHEQTRDARRERVGQAEASFYAALADKAPKPGEPKGEQKRTANKRKKPYTENAEQMGGKQYPQRKKLRKKRRPRQIKGRGDPSGGVNGDQL